MKIKIVEKPDNCKGEIIVPWASSKVKQSEFENNPLPYLFSSPFMYLLTGYVFLKKMIYKGLGLGKPKINTFFFDGLGKNSRKVKEYAASWKALDIVYNHPFPYNKDIGTLLDEFYWNSLNCQSLRNRRKLIKDKLRDLIIERSRGGVVVRVLSLACGSGEVIIELLAELKKSGVVVKTLLIDIDEEAVRKAKELAEKYEVSEWVEGERGDVRKMEDIAKRFSPDIIEMMGFIDYLNQEEAISITTLARSSLKEGGSFLTCNISPNIEMNFLTWVIDWPMVYRKPEQLSDVFEKAGFKEISLFYEPLKIHGIIIGKK